MLSIDFSSSKSVLGGSTQLASAESTFLNVGKGLALKSDIAEDFWSRFGAVGHIIPPQSNHSCHTGA